MTADETRRMPRWARHVMVFGLAAVALFSAGTVLALHTQREAVLVLARDKWWSEKITADDLTTVDIPSDRNLEAIQAGERDTVIGQTVTTGLPAGSVLTRKDLNSPEFPSGGAQLVGLRTEVGQRPAQPIRPGAEVCVSPLPAALPCDADGSSRGGSFRAYVADASEPDPIGVVVVDVMVSHTYARAALAAATRPIIVSLMGP
ncbi:hypothetical protein HFP15_03675 [Amycolatopsis sp. K13G38]|uniref:SAF domain-containing protein n=1 Tax=Amycolatopsis acididurans TaxID=2724524 RepID=A0ABX1IWW0_9PSEU|nr:SAF domain-containing protein [Amycolatopsis acididurans]NKQ51978.1 hypothetical protein [Amycolatopsis acididurans]